MLYPAAAGDGVSKRNAASGRDVPNRESTYSYLSRLSRIDGGGTGGFQAENAATPAPAAMQATANHLSHPSAIDTNMTARTARKQIPQVMNGGGFRLRFSNGLQVRCGFLLAKLKSPSNDELQDQVVG